MAVSMIDKQGQSELDGASTRGSLTGRLEVLGC